MRKLQIWVFIPLAFITLTLAFQNCSGGFAYDPKSGQFSSSVDDATGEFGLRAYSADNRLMSQASPFQPGVAYEVRAVGASTSTALLSWSLEPSSTAACVLNSKGVLNKRELKCSTEGSVTVRLEAYWPDETMTTALHTHSVGTVAPTPSPGNEDENTVAFRILAGTGSGSWNTAPSAIVLFVGQNLRVYNDDNVNHRIATSGAPFVSQTDQIAPNTFKDIPVTSSLAAGSTTTYDANFGTGARVFMTSIDGDVVYAGAGGAGNVQSCQSCHGNIANSNQRGTSFARIKAAIAANTGGMGAITLSDVNLRAVEYALNH